MMNDPESLFFPETAARRPLLIAGPCSAETEEQLLTTARALATAGVGIFRAGVWKPRTKPGGFEGVGARGLAWLARVKAQTGMRTATEVATASHVRAALRAGIDLLWIGARTSANPFAVQEIADALAGTDTPVLVKNPLSPDLELWIGAIERLRNAGLRRIAAVHRGFTTCEATLYRNAPQWSVPIELHRRMPELPLLCDPSHIGGQRELVAPLCQQAMDLGFDGLMIEAHCRPAEAWSDSAQQLTPEALDGVLRGLTIRDRNPENEQLAQLRAEIDRADDELLALLARRMEIARRIGRFKRLHAMPVLQPARYDELLARRASEAVRLRMDPAFIRTLLRAVHGESVRQQLEEDRP
jgi:chorismate mutase